MLVEANASDRLHIGLKSQEAIHCRPKTITLDRQNNFINPLLPLYDIHCSVVSTAFDLGYVLIGSQRGRQRRILSSLALIESLTIKLLGEKSRF